MTDDAFICDYLRTPIGRYGGALASVRADDLAALPIRELLRRHPDLAQAVDEVFLGSANQAGEDNRNLARMASLLAGLPDSVPGATVNRLCASGMEAIAAAARAIKAGEIELAVAGGAELMTRAPLVMGKAEQAFQRSAEVFDTTIGWRFVNLRMKALYGVDSMPETAQNVADEHQVSREDQDAFALRSQHRAAAAQARGTFEAEIVPVETKDRKGAVAGVVKDEHPRADTSSRGAGEAARHRPPRRQRDRRQRVGGQRRSRGADRGVGQGGRGAWTEADRARPRLCDRRRRAAGDGRRPNSSGEEALPAAEADAFEF